MNNSTRQLCHVLIFFLGLMLIFGGIATSTEGACVGGLIITAVNFQQWQKGNQLAKGG